jgi:HD-GYP domain-containing protein (c-di-GMP phosphodiesterase class II)
MTLDRPYRWALSCDDAAEELERHRGTQFDAT